MKKNMKFCAMTTTLILSFCWMSSASALGRNQVGLNAGFNSGGFTLGGEYEYLSKRNLGYGAFARFFQKDDARRANGLFVFGGQVRLHHLADDFDFSVAPGVAIINVDSANNTDNSTSFGPSFSLAVMYSLTPTVSLGLENSRYWIWFDEDLRGLQIDDTSFKFVANF